MKLNLKQLEAFVWVADLGSFRRAAERLHTTQPNISARIAGLEAVLNVTLMERDAGSVRLTGKGRELLEHARHVLRSTEEMITTAGGVAAVEGTLRLGVTEMIVHTWLRVFLKALKDQLPNITVELTVDFSATLSKALHDRGIDLALQNGPFNRATSGTVSLGSYPLIWVASPSLGLPKKAQQQDLTRHPILTHARDTRLFQDVSDHFEATQNHDVRLVPSSNLATCLHMAVDGMGVVALPAAMVQRELAAAELVEINYRWRPASLEFHARYDQGRAAKYVGQAAILAAEISARAE